MVWSCCDYGSSANSRSHTSSVDINQIADAIHEVTTQCESPDPSNVSKRPNLQHTSLLSNSSAWQVFKNLLVSAATTKGQKNTFGFTMEDLPNYDNFTGPVPVLYPDPNPDRNPRYNNPGDCCCPFDCEWDFLYCLDGDSLDFDWRSQPMESLSTNSPPGFATELWPDQLGMSLLGNVEELALPVDLERPFFMPPTTLGNVESSLLAPNSNLYPIRNISASESLISSDSLSIPSTQETLFPVPIPPSPETSASPLYARNICNQYHPNPQRLKYVLSPIMCQPPNSLTLPQSTTH